MRIATTRVIVAACTGGVGERRCCAHRYSVPVLTTGTGKTYWEVFQKWLGSDCAGRTVSGRVGGVAESRGEPGAGQALSDPHLLLSPSLTSSSTVRNFCDH